MKKLVLVVVLALTLVFVLPAVAGATPYISSLSASYGHPGATVVISGTGFIPSGANPITRVSFGTARAGVTSLSMTSITCTVPNMAMGPTKVKVTTIWGTRSPITAISNAVDFTVTPVITVTAPSAASLWPAQSTQTVKWTLNSAVPGGEFRVFLSAASGQYANKYLAAVAGQTAYSTPLAMSCPAGPGYRCCVYWRPVVGSGTWVATAQSASFTVTPVITVTAPTASGIWASGSTQTVAWTLNSAVPGGEFRVLLSAASGQYLDTYPAAVAGQTAYSTPLVVSCPAGPGYQACVYWRPVVGSGNWVATAQSAAFTVTPVITVTAPTAASSWRSGSTQTVAWTLDAAVATGQFRVSLVSSGGTSYVDKQLPPTSGQTSCSTLVGASVPAGPGYRAYVYWRPVAGSGDWTTTAQSDPFTVVPGAFLPKVDFATGKNPQAVAVADFNGDGKRDVVVADVGANTVSVLLGDGAGAFLPKTDFATGTKPTAVAVGDFNGDGKQDLVTANGNSPGSVSVLLGNGSGGFGAKTDFATDSYPVSVAVGDFNGDGKRDLAVACVGLTYESGSPDSHVSVLLGNGSGGFAARTDFSTSSGPASVAVGDFNGDGKQDLVTADHIGPVGMDKGVVSVLLGNGSGGFAAATHFATGMRPYSVAVADVNGDRKQDLVTANNADGTVSVLLGDGSGGFAAKTDFDVGAYPLTVAVGDLNGDGSADLVTANDPWPGDNPGNPTVSMLLGDRSGGFGAAADYTSGWQAHAVALADLNGDGKQDLVTANYGADTVSVLLNALPVFSPTITISNPAAASSWPAGSTQNVTWTVNPALSGGEFRVGFVDVAGSAWYATTTMTPVAGQTSYTKALKVTCPAAVSGYKAYVYWRPVAGTGSWAATAKSAAFTVTPINITSPVATSSWPSGSTQSVTWTVNPAYAAVGEFRVGLMNAAGTVLIDKQVLPTAGKTSYALSLAASVPAASGYRAYVSYRPVVGGANAVVAKSAAFTVTPINITSPTATSSWPSGSTQAVTWTVNPAYAAVGEFRVGLVSADNLHWYLGKQVLPTAGKTSYALALAASVPAGSYKAYVYYRPTVGSGAWTATCKSAAFPVTPMITITSPTASSSWPSGTTQSVTWNVNLACDSGEFRVSVWNLAGTMSYAAAQLPAAAAQTSYTQALTLTCPAAVAGYQAYVEWRPVVGTGSWTATRKSAAFTVTPIVAPTITVDAPTASSNWPSGSSQTVSWTLSSAVAAGEFRIWLVSSGGTSYIGMQVLPVAAQTSYGASLTASVPAGSGYVASVRWRPTVGSGDWAATGQSAAFTVGAPVVPALLGSWSYQSSGLYPQYWTNAFSYTFNADGTYTHVMLTTGGFVMNGLLTQSGNYSASGISIHFFNTLETWAPGLDDPGIVPPHEDQPMPDEDCSYILQNGGTQLVITENGSATTYTKS